MLGRLEVDVVDVDDRAGRGQCDDHHDGRGDPRELLLDPVQVDEQDACKETREKRDVAEPEEAPV